MSGSAKSTSLVLHIRAPDANSQSLFPVEAAIDEISSVVALAPIEVTDFQALEGSPWEYGRKLGECLFRGEALKRILLYARGRAGAGNRVSLSLRIDESAAKLHNLIWERMIFGDGEQETVFGVSESLVFSRNIPTELPAGTFPAEGPFRLLLVIASPTDLFDNESSTMTPVDVSAEITSLRTAWDSQVTRGLLAVKILARVSNENREALLAAGYKVNPAPCTLNTIADELPAVDSIHLICHGSFRKGVTHLLLENEEGTSKDVPEEDFLAKLGDNRRLRLVFLHACNSAKRQAGIANFLSGLAPKVAMKAAAVVAMQDFVEMKDARRFAQEFYEKLLVTGSADVATNAGRLVLYRRGSNNWSIPALYLAPGADPIWQPDAILAAIQDLAEEFRQQPDIKSPFPIEVVQKVEGVSSNMETSPPGPRIGLLEAVENMLFPNSGTGFSAAIISGNHGRAKTAQLNRLYCHYAEQVPNGRPLPLFMRIRDFDVDDDASVQELTRAISRTYKNAGFEMDPKILEERLSQPFIVFLDGRKDLDNRQTGLALNCILAIAQEWQHARFVLTLDETFIDQSPSLKIPGCLVVTLLVQLLTSATVAQHLLSLPPDEKGVTLLKAIQQSNLFDFASVPWLLGSLIRQPRRSVLSRAGVIQRAINSSLAGSNSSAGVRSMVQEVFGRIAWTLQMQKATRLDGNGFYELLGHVRGKREVPLEDLRSAAMEAKVLCPSQRDGVRFTYPGFQSFWCAKHLLASGEAAMPGHLDDITATLGRRSRVRLWEDTLVLLAGLMPDPNKLVRRILSSSSLSSGEQVFLAATCIHEARLNGKQIAPGISAQVLDSLVWRSTPMKERNASVRIRATESLGLLRNPDSIPHLLSLLLEQIRMTSAGKMTFELSGLRRAALEVLLTMRDDTEKYVESLAGEPSAQANIQCLPALIHAWTLCDTEALQNRFLTSNSGIPAVIAFILATLGGGNNLEFLARQIVRPETADDTIWAISDALLLFNPLEVTELAVKNMCANPSLQPQAASLIGNLRIAVRGNAEFAFLESCLNSSKSYSQGMALRSLAQLGSDAHREFCENIACNEWDKLPAEAIRRPISATEKMTLYFFAVEGLRSIGTQASLDRLRQARPFPIVPGAEQRAADLNQLRYEVSEDIFWRVSGELEGDF